MNDPYRIVCYPDGNFAVEEFVDGGYQPLERFGKGEAGLIAATNRRNELFTKLNYNHGK
ncbi:MAG: hypothetical protein J6Q93_00315 [Prevotella sp.]|nr:hypothetical protein [Prevotella sp.]